MASPISFMFERWTKKATDNAVDNVKKTLNDRIDEYGDIIKIGLVLSVIILGGKHLTKRSNNKYVDQYALPQSNAPIVINNYYTREREDIRYGRRESETSRQRQVQSRSKR